MRFKSLGAIALAFSTLVLDSQIPVGEPPKAYASDIQVSVFNAPGLNGSGCSGENANLLGIIGAISGYSADGSIVDFVDADGDATLASQLASSTFFFMTDMEASFADPDSSSFLPDSAKTAFRNWTNSGGVMVMTGTSGDKDTRFLNNIYGFDLSNRGGSTATEITANTAGTPFENATGGVSLQPHSATDSVGRGSVSGFTAMWTTDGLSSGNAAVAVIQYGSGYVIYLSWDFYDSGPGCGQYNSPWVQDIVPAALEYASNLAGVSALANLSIEGGDLAYEYSQDGTSFFVVTSADDTAPSAAQVKAGIDYSGGTILGSGSASTTGNTSHPFQIRGLSPAEDYVVYAVTEYGSPAQLSNVSATSFSTKPGVPSVSSVTAGNGQVSVNISPFSSETNFEYTVDDGNSVTTRSPVSASSPWVISGLTNGSTYSFKFRSVYNNQKGAWTSAVEVTPRPPAVYLSSLTTNQGTLSPAFDSGTLQYSFGVANSVATIEITPISAGNSITVAGASVSSGQSSAPIPLNVGPNSIQVSVVSGATGAVPTNYSLVVTRAQAVSTKRSPEPTYILPAPIPAPPPQVVAPPQTSVSVAQVGPVLIGGIVPKPPKAPSVLLGGRPATVATSVPTTTQLDVRAGSLSLGVKVQENLGQISETPDGSTEIAVRKGAAATITGAGFRPGATVQVFMPLQGDNAKELTRIPVQPDGSFDGSAPFATRPNEAPLPIGKNVLQLVSLDNDGNQVVVEMAVNIAQGAPAPEQNRIDGVIPAMAPGQSVATSGGEPVPVTITPVSEQKLAVVEGDGWTMAVNVAAEDGGVEPSEGGALLKLVRNESALISGSGFMPGTRADVWLFSDPTLLGTVTIDENGEFTGEVNIDPNMIPVGEHTLQLQGVGEDGYVKAANLGVLVDDAAEAAPTAVEQGLGFIWWIIAALVVLALIVVLIASRRRKDA